MPLPNYITAIRSVAYNTKEIRESLEFYDDSPAADAAIMALIDEWAYEEFGDGYRLLNDEGEEL